MPHRHPEELTSIMAPWLFAQWRMDLIGPFSVARDVAKFVIVTVNCFIKWVEAKDLASITSQAITKFLWKSVICRFGIP